jgi:hypothetical protein
MAQVHKEHVAGEITVSMRGRAFVVHGLDLARPWPATPNTAAMRRRRHRLRRF